MKRTEFDILN